MDGHAGKTVSDADAGYRLIAERFDNHPKLGEDAPDFELPLYRGDDTLRLSSFRGKAPVAVIFGSLT